MDEITRCFTAHRPVATVYLKTASAVPQAAATATRRWRSMRRELQREGVDDDTLRTIDGAVGVDSEAVERGIGPAVGNVTRSDQVDGEADHAGGDVLAVVAAGGAVLLRRFLSADDAAGDWQVGALPRVTPLLRARQASIPHLTVLLDRQGADMWGTVRTPDGDADIVTEVQGNDHQITLVNQGGWSHRRIHERAKNRWQANAKEVAGEVSDLVRAHRPDAVLIAGDVAAIGFFEEALPGDVSPLLRHLEAGARGPENGPEGVADEVAQQLRTIEAEQTTAVLEEWRERSGREAQAATTALEVVAALQMAIVGTLLVPADGDGPQAWFGPEPTHVALSRDALVAMGVEEPERAALVDVAVRAALGTGAEVRIVPEHALTNGIGALLRGQLVAGGAT